MLTAARPAPPSDDPRWKLVDATMRRLGYKSHALIETLHTVQSSFGFVDETALIFVAQSLRVPLSRAYGVTTFYHYFTMKPPGKHTCVVCMGTACYIKGAQTIVNDLEKMLGIKSGETTPDQKVSLLNARCIGSCGLAPAVVFDGTVSARTTQQQAKDKVQHWMNE